jgi:hypothetical protein
MNVDLPGIGDADGWNYRGTVPVPGLGSVSFWRHETGAGHAHAWDVPGKPAFVLAFRTESASDRGAAHVLEHLAGAGSRRYPCGSAIYTAMLRSMTDFANGFTETGRTSYTFVTADVEDYALMLDVVLDGVYWPILGKREFIRDGARHGRSGRLTGAVYNEMQLKIEREDEWISRLLARRSAPSGFAQYRHEGTPEAVAALRYDECVRYHQRWYWPEYAISFSAGASLRTALRGLGSAHRERDADPRPGPPEEAGRGTEPLSAPARLLGQAWTVAEVRLPCDTAANWVLALALTKGWRRATAGDRRCDVVGLPVLADGRLSAWCALRGSGNAGLISDLAGASAARAVAVPDVSAHLSDRYRGLPSGIRWGLALAPLCAAALDQARFWEADQQADFPLLTIAEVSSEQAAGQPAPTWSAERADSDDRIWLGARVPGEALVLPMRRLKDRLSGGSELRLDCARPAPGGGVVVSRAGSVRRYHHLALAADPETACLLQPVTDVIRRRLPPDSPGDVLGDCQVRSAGGGRPVSDLVLPAAAEAVGSWRAWLRDPEVAAEIRAEFASRHKQLRAWVITRPADVAARLCAARASATGCLNELLAGYSPVRRLSVLLEDSGLLGESLSRIGAALDSRASDSGADLGPAAPEIPPALMTSGVCVAAWDAGEVPETDWPALLVTTAHLQRYLHERVREDGGAYGATMQPDLLARTVVAKSQADPEPGRTLEIYQSMWTEAADRASVDDLEMAKLMAVQAERARRAAVTYLAGLEGAAPRLNQEFAGLIDQVDLSAMKRAGSLMAAKPFHAFSLPRQGTAEVLQDFKGRGPA